MAYVCLWMHIKLGMKSAFDRSGFWLAPSHPYIKFSHIISQMMATHTARRFAVDTTRHLIKEWRHMLYVVLGLLIHGFTATSSADLFTLSSCWPITRLPNDCVPSCNVFLLCWFRGSFTSITSSWRAGLLRMTCNYNSVTVPWSVHSTILLYFVGHWRQSLWKDAWSITSQMAYNCSTNLTERQDLLWRG